MDNLRDTSSLKAFGTHLRKLRELKKISQETLGLNIGSYQSTIIRIEHGKSNPKLSTLIAIAKELNISLKELVDF
jgi:transcriptional regulator with XRE-family HTH domain